MLILNAPDSFPFALSPDMSPLARQRILTPAPRTSYAYAVPLLIASAVMAAVFAADVLTSFHIAIAVLYVIAIQLMSATGSARLTLAASALCSILTVVALPLSHETFDHAGPLGRVVVALLAIAVGTSLSMRHLLSVNLMREQIHLLNLSHDAIVIYDMRGLVTFWNHGAEALYGWSAGEAVGKDFHSLTQTRLKSSRETIMETLCGEGRWEGEVQRVHRSGRRLVVSSRIALCRDKAHRPIAVMATNNDITARREAESKLARSETMLADAQKLSKTGSILYSASSDEMIWSDETYRILGYDFGRKPTLKLILDRTHRDDAVVLSDMSTAMQNGDPAVDIQIRLMMPDAEAKTIRFVARLTSNAPDPQYVGALMDVSATVAAQEAIQRSLKELAHISRVTTLDGLTSTVAHEITRPLAAITTCGYSALTWLSQPEPNIADATESVEQMIRDAQRSSDLVKQIRGMAQRRDFQAIEVCANQLVRDALDLLSHEFKAARVFVQTKFEKARLDVRGDPVQLQQVLVNLLMNAVQAMASLERQKILSVNVELAEDSRAKIVIRDNGPGFHEGDISRLFSAFFTTKQNGVGMGLAICRTIIDAHGGSIWATSSTPGATFHIALPSRAGTALCSAANPV